MCRKKPGIFLLIAFAIILPASGRSQFVIADVINLVVKKVINAIDIAVQQAQNKTIVLQNAQKELENAMSKLQLDEITDWVEKQRKLYEDYYQELWQVKQIIAGYDRLKEIAQWQSRIVSKYNQASALFKQDKHFTADDLDHMARVYAGILKASLQNLNQSLLVANSLVTQMDDASRIRIIDQASAGMHKNYLDLQEFNQENIRLSMQRAQNAGDVEAVKKLYGLE